MTFIKQIPLVQINSFLSIIQTNTIEFEPPKINHLINWMLTKRQLTNLLHLVKLLSVAAWYQRQLL